MALPFSQRPLWFALACALGLAALLHLPAFLVAVPFALSSKLFSFTLLIPWVSAYLVYTDKQRHEPAGTPWWPLALVAGALAVFCVMSSNGLWAPARTGPRSLQLWVAWRMAAWVATVWCLAALLGGRRAWQTYTFPLLYLAAAVPVSPHLEQILEHWLQNGSAEVYAVMIMITGPVFFRTGTVFQLPGITLEIAPECSGINSTVVLFVVSLVAGYLFLRSPWRRVALAVAVIPLALLRNGFRVWVLTQLCVHDDISWIDSPLHHEGGPIFFALSLIPFSALLWWLHRSDRRGAP